MPAAEACGYEAKRADQISEPGIITSQVIQHIVEDPMVIADLTGHNPNVFYELALRHALKKPLVQSIKKGESIPFDVATTRTIQIDLQDPDNVEAARTEMIAQMQAVKGEDVEVDNPISLALDLRSLRQSDRAEDRSYAEVLDALAATRKEILALQEQSKESEERITHGNRFELRRLLDSILEHTPGISPGMLSSADIDQLRQHIFVVSDEMGRLDLEKGDPQHRGILDEIALRLGHARMLLGDRVRMPIPPPPGYPADRKPPR